MYVWPLVGFRGMTPTGGSIFLMRPWCPSFGENPPQISWWACGWPNHLWSCPNKIGLWWWCQPCRGPRWRPWSWWVIMSSFHLRVTHFACQCVNQNTKCIVHMVADVKVVFSPQKHNKNNLLAISRWRHKLQRTQTSANKQRPREWQNGHNHMVIVVCLQSAPLAVALVKLVMVTLPWWGGKFVLL